MSRVAQNVAEDPHAQKAHIEPSAAQTLSTKDATAPGDTKPGLAAAKIEMSSGLPEASGKVAPQLRQLYSRFATAADRRFQPGGMRKLR